MVDFALKGYYSEGCDFSFYMQLGYNFIFDSCHQFQEHRIFPFTHVFYNRLSLKNVFQEVKIPDLVPSENPKITENVNFVPYEFVEFYSV